MTVTNSNITTMSLFSDMTTKTFKKTKQKGYILTLDGGGTRGLVEITILQQIEKRTGQRVQDLFDLIGGTSTGGILAYLLGVKNKSVEECKSLYVELASTIFGATRIAKTKNLVSSVGMETYETKLLEAFSKRYMGEDVNLSSFDSNEIKVFAVSINEVNPKHPFLFRTYSNPNSDYEGTNSANLWEAALATSAAPTYFRKREIKGLGTFIDGGMGFNNPSEIAWFEAKKLWKHDIKCMLSLGTGDVKNGGKASNPMAMASQLIDVVTSSHQVHLRIKQFVSNYNPDTKYFRLNPPELGRFDLAESSSSILDIIQKETLDYLEKEVEFQNLCNVLSNRINIDF